MGLPKKLAKDDGQLTLLVIGYFLVAVLLITVVINVSRVFIVRRALHGVADGAAIAAANALDETRIYRGELTDYLPLTQAGAEETVARYVQTAAVGPPRFPGFGYSVATDGTTVSVTAECLVELPIVNLVSEEWATVPLTARASARSPVAR